MHSHSNFGRKDFVKNIATEFDSNQSPIIILSLLPCFWSPHRAKSYRNINNSVIFRNYFIGLKEELYFAGGHRHRHSSTGH